ncbi:hypothetical protein JOE61_003563 [Nocardioides salarius]|uniref:Uncharacterized protein n=1 Tax=Nocardioides salarius TaxID=374513 RepID=A0ABS2MEY0_9ACTN|nr:hypothetical protein [Nocardioides salarius]
MTRRDRDVRLGYAGLLVGAGSFVAALVVTTTLVDVLPDLGAEKPVLAAQQRVLTGAQLRPEAPGPLSRRPAPEATDRAEGQPAAPVAQPGATPAEPVTQSVAQPVAQPAPSASGPRGPQGPAPSPPSTPPSTPPGNPGTPPGGGGEGPVSSLLDPVAAAVTQSLDELTGGLSQPAGATVVRVVDTLGEVADRPFGDQVEQLDQFKQVKQLDQFKQVEQVRGSAAEGLGHDAERLLVVPGHARARVGLVLVAVEARRGVDERDGDRLHRGGRERHRGAGPAVVVEAEDPLRAGSLRGGHGHRGHRP